MKLTKLVALMLVMLLSVSVFAGCSTSGEQSDAGDQQTGDKKRIGVAVLDFSDQFMTYVMDGMKEEAKKYGDEIEVIYVDAKYDSSKQLGQVENFIAQQVDAIVLLPVDAEASVPMAQSVIDAGIPLITVNRQLGNQEIATSYAGSDSIESGEIEMQAVAEKLGGKGNIVLIEGTYGHEAQIERAKGIKNVLAKYPDIKVLAQDTGKWMRDEGMLVTENWLQSDLRDKIDAVVAHNDEMAIGALKALEDAGLLDKVLVAGIDATPEAIQYLKDGKLDITVFQDAKSQGAKGIEVAVKAIKGEEVEKEYMIPYELVNPEQADEYLAKYGK